MTKFSIRTSMCFALLACDGGCAADSAVKIGAFDSVVGWLHGRCFAIQNAGLKENVELLIVNLDSQALSVAKIGHKASGGEECYALLDDRKTINMQSGGSFYTVDSGKPIEMAIGLLPSGQKAKNGRLDLNRDGKEDSIHYCSTAEGMQFSVWEGEAYQSRMLWSGYYYLGYDIEETCPPD